MMEALGEKDHSVEYEFLDGAGFAFFIVYTLLHICENVHMLNQTFQRLFQQFSLLSKPEREKFIARALAAGD